MRKSALVVLKSLATNGIINHMNIKNKIMNDENKETTALHEL